MNQSHRISDTTLQAPTVREGYAPSNSAKDQHDQRQVQFDDQGEYPFLMVGACPSLRHDRYLRAGFTMIELLVAIGIMIILMGITLPMLGAIGRGTGQANTINEISASMGAARAVAMKEGKDTVIIFRGTRGNNITEPYGTGPMQVIIGIRNDDTTKPGFEPYENRGPVAMPAHCRIAGVTSMGTNPDWLRPSSIDPLATSANEKVWIGVCFGSDGRVKSLDSTLTDAGVNAPYYDEDSSNSRSAVAGNYDQRILFVPVLATYDARTITAGVDENSLPELKGFINAELKDVNVQAVKQVRAIFFDSYTGQILK